MLIGEGQISWESLWMLRTRKSLGDMQIFNGRTRSIECLLTSPSNFIPQEFSTSPLISSSPVPLDSSQLSCDLWEAANSGRADTTRLLLASGADPNRLVPKTLRTCCTPLSRKGPA